MQQVLQHHNTFRFYSSSLLIMYDGSVYPVDNELSGSEDRSTNTDHKEAELSCRQSEGHLPSSTLAHSAVDVRMIDFAHTTHKGFCRDDKLHQGPDKGYLFGLDNLIKAFHRLRDMEMPSYEIV